VKMGWTVRWGWVAALVIGLASTGRAAESGGASVKDHAGIDDAIELAKDETPSQPPKSEPSKAESSASTHEATSASTEATGTEDASATASETESGLISIDFKDADIRQVLRIIALKSGVDIVAGPAVEGVVTIKLTNVPWEQALDIILRTYGLAYERKDKVIRVMTLEAVEQEALSTEVFPLGYAKAKEVTEIIKEMASERGRVKFDDRTNTVIVTDLPSNLFQLRSVISRLDQATPQVHIESKIVETTLTKDDNVGIDWFDSAVLTVAPATLPTTFPYPGSAQLGGVLGSLVPRAGTFSPSDNASLQGGRIPDRGGQITFGTIGIGSLATTLNMLKQRVNTNVLSHPTIVTLNNKEAFVQVGEDINIPNFQIDPSTGRATVTGFQTRSTGVIMRVTPHVNPQEEIVLDLKPEITTVGTTFDTFASGISFPRFTVQKAETQVRLRNGQTLVIGGLVKRQTTVTNDKVPILGDIPVVGLLFTHRRENTTPHQDLLIMLTVRLVEEEAIARQRVPPSTASSGTR